MMRLPQGEKGIAPVEFALGASLLLIPMVILVLSFAPWIERQMVARTAAREAARVIVLGDDFDLGRIRAEQLVNDIAGNHGLTSADLSLSVAGAFVRGGSITATVSVAMPDISVPLIGDFGFGLSTWTTSHTEQVDLYRSFP